MKYGGHGYSHILLNVLPKMRARGISDDVIDNCSEDVQRDTLALRSSASETIHPEVG